MPKLTIPAALSACWLALVAPFGVALAQTAAPDPEFKAWIEAFRQQAVESGISASTIELALENAEPIPRVLELDRRQPEFTQTFWRYVDARVNDRRIQRGRTLLKTHGKLLESVRRKYGVQPRFLVSFWGLESNFGDHFGGFPVVQALVTLAYDPRRSKFFRAQLLDALKILDRGDITLERMRGSWAGAMGHLQFIPSTFVRYAVDGDGDGRRDIWSSLPDTFESAANYLSQIGWDGKRTWGREIRIPKNFDFQQASLKIRKPLKEWDRLGVRNVKGGKLPTVDITGSVVLPSGHRGPAFLVYHNFHRILNWNRSVLYAIAVGHLADRYAGMEPLNGPRPASETPLSRGMIQEIQELLNGRGYDAGQPDGVIGPLTRAAIQSFQKSVSEPPDGFPTIELLKKLRDG